MARRELLTVKTFAAGLTAAALIGLVFGAALLFSCGFVHADGPYQGRVVDAQTGEPIRGAAVLAVWWKVGPGLGHPAMMVHDAREAVTDKEGRFSIPGTRALPGPWRVQEPSFTIYKPGYEALAEWAPGGNEILAGLHNLKTRDERVKALHRIYTPLVPERNYPHLKKLEAEERANLGLPQGKGKRP